MTHSRSISHKNKGQKCRLEKKVENLIENGLQSDEVSGGGDKEKAQEASDSVLHDVRMRPNLGLQWVIRSAPQKNISESQQQRRLQ